MDGGNYAEELIYNIQYDLVNIEILQPGVFVEQLLCFPLAGLEERVLGLLRQAIHQFQNERMIMKYIYIIDKLMKVPSLIPAIQNSIIDIYSQLFMFLLQQKCSTEIEELKILRKYWVGKIHPYYLSQIKEILLQRTNIDIDCGFKSETINRIRQYYSTKLNMSPEEMAQHLPQSKKSEDRYVANSMNNQRYMVEATSIYPQNSYNHINTLSNISNMNINPIPYNNYSIPSYPPVYNHYPSSFQPQNRGSYTRFPPAEGSHGEEVKRKRLASEETRAAIPGAMFEGVQPNPRKLQHKNEVIIDYKYMLSKLKRMNPFSCRECGLQFMTTDSYESHRGDHFKEKLTKNEKNARQGKSGKLCSVQDWLDKSDLGFSLDQFYISIPKQEIQARLCDFCCAPLNIDFRNNQWIYTNAAIVTINGQPATIHKSCHLALETQNEQD